MGFIRRGQPVSIRTAGRRGLIRLLAIDIDGTLLDSRGRVPDAHRDAIVEASARGIEIAIATGRSFHFSQAIADAPPVPLTLSAKNGAMVKDRARHAAAASARARRRASRAGRNPRARTASRWFSIVRRRMRRGDP